MIFFILFMSEYENMSDILWKGVVIFFNVMLEGNYKKDYYFKNKFIIVKLYFLCFILVS